MQNILIVEDNPLDLKLVSQLIKTHFDLKIDMARDGREAIAYLNKNEYSLVITDIIMPHIEGIELINKIKERYPDTSIIAVSSGKPFYLYLAKKLGINGVFTKPLDKDRFLHSLSNLLALPLKTKMAF